MKRKPFKRISFIQSVLNNVYKKLVFLTLLCSLLPLLLVSVISYRLSYRISKNHTIDSLKATNTQIALNIDNRLKQIEQLSGTITFYLYNLYNTPLRPLSSYLKVFSDSKNNLGTIKGTFHLFQPYTGRVPLPFGFRTKTCSFRRLFHPPRRMSIPAGTLTVILITKPCTMHLHAISDSRSFPPFWQTAGILMRKAL